MFVTIELTEGELAMLRDQFHDTGEKLMLAENLLPRLQRAVEIEREKARKRKAMQEKVDEAHGILDALFGGGEPAKPAAPAAPPAIPAFTKEDHSNG